MDSEHPKAYNKTTGKRGLIQMSILFFLLVVTPYLSWHYLSKGLGYRKQTLAQLGDFGRLPSELEDRFIALSPPLLDTPYTLMILGLCYELVDCEKMQDVLKRLTEPFGKKDDVRLVCVRPQTFEFREAATPQVYKFSLDSETMSRLQTDWRKSFNKEINHHLFLVDKNLNVRQAFDYKDERQLSQLIHAASVLLPLKKVSKAVLKREQEK